MKKGYFHYFYPYHKITQYCQWNYALSLNNGTSYKTVLTSLYYQQDIINLQIEIILNSWPSAPNLGNFVKRLSITSSNMHIKNLKEMVSKFISSRKLMLFFLWKEKKNHPLFRSTLDDAKADKLCLLYCKHDILYLIHFSGPTY